VLIRHHTINTYAEAPHVFLTSVPDGGYWLFSRSGRCSLGERAIDTNCCTFLPIRSYMLCN